MLDLVFTSYYIFRSTFYTNCYNSGPTFIVCMAHPHYWLVAMTSSKIQIYGYLPKDLSMGKMPHFKYPPNMLS